MNYYSERICHVTPHLVIKLGEEYSVDGSVTALLRVVDEGLVEVD